MTPKPQNIICKQAFSHQAWQIFMVEAEKERREILRSALKLRQHLGVVEGNIPIPPKLSGWSLCWGI